MSAALAEPLNETGAGLQIHLRFLTDRCTAARVDDRKQAEWPPHPGRFFMALAAAYFETDAEPAEKDAERRALDWLAALPPPQLRFASFEQRTSFDCYVPVNDANEAIKSMLQSAPGLPRSRQPRSFPTAVRLVGSGDEEPDVTYCWPEAPDFKEHAVALERLCRHVIRVGHSSSLVTAWTTSGEASGTVNIDVWQPTSSAAEFACRLASAGELDRLAAACRAERIDAFAALKAEIETTTGKAQTAAKKRFAEMFGEPYKASVRPPEPTPPTLGVWQGYARVASAGETIHTSKYFDPELIILEKFEGPTLNVERTLALTQALRATFMAGSAGETIPAWLSGHEPDGSPTTRPHAAFLALPFVGHKHADGHVMGLALALPRSAEISVAERRRWLGRVLIDSTTGDAAKPQLKLWGREVPDWTLQLEQRTSPPLMLQTATWTQSATTWASVTPVVLDRFPKADRGREREAWHAEVTEIVRQACVNAGLPEPLDVDLDSTAWHVGAPRAWCKSRPLRGGGDARAAFGEGFPPLPAKASRPSRPQIHVWLRFGCRVQGPVLLGAGRFAGYGLCLPVRSESGERT